MPDPARLRASTQIVLPAAAVAELREDIEARFTVTVCEEGEAVRIVASPVVITRVSAFLARRGVSVR